MDNEGSKTLEEIVGRISAKSFSKYSFKESQIITGGVSIFDVVQEKLKEYLRRNRKPNANPLEDAGWIDRNINQGVRKLYKNSKNFDSLDDAHLNRQAPAQESKIQTKLEKYEIIQKVLETYSSRKKAIVGLRLFQEIDYQEVAQRTGTTEGNVRKVICEFKKDCREFGLEPSEQNENCRGENNGK